MMLPPVYSLLSADPYISTVVGKAIYAHGAAPIDVTRPYITWFLVSGSPLDQLSGAPCTDFDLVQIDVWSRGVDEVVSIARAVRNLLDSKGNANRVVMDTFDKDTKLYRHAIETSFIRNR